MTKSTSNFVSALASKVKTEQETLTKTRSDYAARISQAEKKAAAAAAAMNAAVESGDPTAYSRAKSEMNAANDELELFRIKLEKFSKEGVIPAEEGLRRVAAIKATLAEEEAAVAGEIKELVGKIREVADGYDAVRNQLKDLLQALYALNPDIAPANPLNTPFSGYPAVVSLAHRINNMLNTTLSNSK